MSGVANAADEVCTSLTLAPTPASPQTVGTAVTWTAIASGCTSPQYKYWTLAPGATAWQLARDWGVGTFAWSTTSLAAGTWTVQVWARQSGSTATYDKWTQTTYMLNAATSSPCTSLTLAPTPASPQTVGTAVTWTAIASGCTSPQYKYWTLAPRAAPPHLARDWGVGTFAWSTTSLAAGTWTVQVWARQSG